MYIDWKPDNIGIGADTQFYNNVLKGLVLNDGSLLRRAGRRYKRYA